MADYHEEQPTVFVLDFGAQYAQLIARRVREARVYSEIVPFDIPAHEVAARKPAAIILSGGPASVYAEGAPHMDPEVLALGIPVLGFCYGIQEMALQLGGDIPRTDIGEYGFAEMTVTTGDSVLLQGLPTTSQCWMSHRDSVGNVPDGFTVTACTATTAVAAMEDAGRKLFATQFHPEVAHTEYGQQIIRTFLHDIAEIPPIWTMLNIIEETVERVREQVGGDRVICGLSGGVDSSVVAALLHRAIGDQLT
ncbi:MAG: glutamine-hydrolyzing GMP synthase, partial [Coriobacteriia bacterium]